METVEHLFCSISLTVIEMEIYSTNNPINKHTLVGTRRLIEIFSSLTCHTMCLVTNFFWIEILFFYIWKECEEEIRHVECKIFLNR